MPSIGPKAARLGLGLDTVSRIERRSDILLSTLRRYGEAMGGELQLIPRFANCRRVNGRRNAVGRARRSAPIVGQDRTADMRCLWAALVAATPFSNVASLPCGRYVHDVLRATTPCPMVTAWAPRYAVVDGAAFVPPARCNLFRAPPLRL